MISNLRIRFFLFLSIVFTTSAFTLACSIILLPKIVVRSNIEREKEAVLALADSGNLDGAIERALKALEVSPEQDQLQALLASALLQKGSASFDEKAYADRASISAFKIASSKPSSSLGYYLLGYASEIKQNYKEAFSWYNIAIANEPNLAHLYSARGHAYDLDGQSERAITDFKQALELDQSDVAALLNMARIELRKANYDQAVAFAKKAAESEVNVYQKSEALLVQGYSAIRTGKSIEAISIMSEAQNLTPESPSILLGVAQAKFASLPSVKTQAEFVDTVNNIFFNTQKATELNPNHSLAFLLAARTFKLIGNLDAAQNLYHIAASACPDDITLNKTEKEKLCADITREKDLSIKL